MDVPDVSKLPVLLTARRLRDPKVRKVMGRAIVGVLRRHFTRLDSERPNSLGGQRTHFYGKARRAVRQPELVGGDGVKVVIDQQGLAQRYYGGDIRAKDKALTIPVHPDAYGHRAREFSDLEYQPTRGGRYFAMLVRPYNNGSIGEVMYLLARVVYQKPDKSVLPTEDTLRAAAFEAGNAYVLNLLRRKVSGQ